MSHILVISAGGAFLAQRFDAAWHVYAQHVPRYGGLGLKFFKRSEQGLG